MATLEVFSPPGSCLYPRSGLSKRPVSDHLRNLVVPRLTNWNSHPPSFSLLGRYFCEPAYEKFRGSNEGALNSRLYNEKAYVLSRGFILRALENPPSSLEDEIRGFYLSSPSPERVEAEDVMDQDQERGEGSSQGHGGGQRRLEKVLKNSEELISLSYALQQQLQPQTVPFGQVQPADLAGPPPTPDEDAAVPKLTAGGILTLRRVLVKLSDIQRNHPQRPPGTTFMSS